MSDFVNFRERFDCDSQCQLVALDFIYFYLNNTLIEYEEIAGVKGLYQILKFLRCNDFSFTLSTPFLSILSPNFWVLKFRYFTSVTFGKKMYSKMNRFLKDKRKFAIMGEGTGRQLYGLKGGNWSHFVVLYYNSEIHSLDIYDPLEVIIRTEERCVVVNNQMCRQNKLNTMTLKILIWKN